MEEIIGGIIFWTYILFVPWKIKKNITFYILVSGIILTILGLIFLFLNIIPEYRSLLFAIGVGSILLHFFTIFTSRGAWADSGGIDSYNQSKRIFLGICPFCNKKISRTAKVCPHCTTELF